MADSTAKHGPRLDDELKKDTGSRAEEQRRWEGPEDAEPGQRPHREDVPPTSDGVLREEEVEARSDLARFVQPSVFPADKKALVSSALSEHAPAWVVDVLQRLPDDGGFANFEEVWERVGGRREERG